MSTWRDIPEPIPAGDIARSYDAEVVVIGLGYAGSAAFRAACEAGASTIGIELMEEDRYDTLGRDIGHINSKFLEGRGVPKVDTVDFFNEIMYRAGNRANAALIMKFAKTSGEAFDWFVDMYSEEEKANIDVAFWPHGGRFDGAQGFNRFWIGTARFHDSDTKGYPAIYEVCLDNHKKGRERGGQTYFGTDARQLVMDGERVAAVIAWDRQAKEYVRYNASKGVILAAGDFSANAEMCKDLLPDLQRMLVEGERTGTIGGRNGRGIQLGVQAGGRLEGCALGTMNADSGSISNVLNNFGVLWLDYEGNRFCNEAFGDPVFTGFAMSHKKRTTYYSIFDSRILEDVQWAVPAHGSFEPNNPFFLNRLKDTLEKAYAAGKEGYRPSAYPRWVGKDPGTIRPVYAADTIEQVADYVGLEGDARENAIASYYRYNEVCRAGRDEDFGKDAKLLRPLDDGPVYMEVVEGGGFGRMLVTVGGLVTDENQDVLGENYDRIPGLYATGNCCGGRFGAQYSTPVSGISIGMAVTLGRLAGIAAAEQ